MKTPNIPTRKKHFFRCIDPSLISTRFAEGEELASFGPSIERAKGNIYGDGEAFEFVRTEEEPYKHSETAAAIAAHLGEDWSVEPLSDEYLDCNFYLQRADGLALFLEVPGHWSTKDKWAARACLPRHKGDYIEPRNENGKIAILEAKISASKTPEQIAKDITRRVLPNAEEVTKACLATIAKYTEAENKREASLKTFCEALGMKYSAPGENEKLRDSRYNRIYFPGGHAEISYNGGVELHFERMPVTEAIRLAKGGNK